ncbi:MAG: hypothetical protein WAV85_14575 [Rhodoferax sp.]
MSFSTASVLKSSPVMASSSTRHARPGAHWWHRLGRVVLNAFIKSGESRARAALRARNFY